MHLILPLLLGCGACAASAATPAPTPAYQSAFAGYKPFDDAKPGDWKQINVDIAKSPGHAGMHGSAHEGHTQPAAAKQVAAPAAASAPAPAPNTSVAKPDPHAGHTHH